MSNVPILPYARVRRPSTFKRMALGAAIGLVGLTNHEVARYILPSSILREIPTWTVESHPNGVIAGLRRHDDIIGVSTFYNSTGDSVRIMACHKDPRGAGALYHTYASLNLKQ